MMPVNGLTPCRPAPSLHFRDIVPHILCLSLFFIYTPACAHAATEAVMGPTSQEINSPLNPLQQYPLLVEQTLLLDLAGVSPVFSANYRTLSQWQAVLFDPDQVGLSHAQQDAELLRMQEQISTYWHFIATTANKTSSAEEDPVVEIPVVEAPFIETPVTETPVNDPRYVAVLNKISQLVQLEDKGAWEPLVLEEKLTLGQASPIVNTLAQRLWLLGDSPTELSVPTEANEGQIYTEELMQLIQRFQRRHGLEADGVVGKQTLFWLNQSPYKRAQLLAKNEVSQRVFSQTLSPSYLLINVPAFEMKLVVQGELALRSKVIVGKPSRQTPILDSQISNVVLNPNWRVPRSILRRDILPHIRKDGHYLSERGFDVYNVEGQRVHHSPEEWQALASSHFPFKLVQRPGPRNALGKYKFHFENDFSVYLHGTSEPSLFKKADRALSSGCIRVERVDELALWFKAHLIKDTALWDRLAPVVTQPQWFALSDKLPVHLVYWTAWLDDQGLAQYRNDIYHLEAELTNAVPAVIFYQP
ncbi:L,D-transpeptidase family protein [Shewanella sp. CG12_big_fil_rev_8_21_14_0_65_47_15]|uniref:L,D-transpeptidase family protein n=1 Tax=Shewanella sp. CG12_big_fil_rev_8_21_14_0_65_47_15 TaxID=1975537 RepID=UPI0025FF98FC|nr:L,D-transpeptidase family protein [Shewanella sp. CG12_big_fil_rev_8_21_14_0_65_47_15]